VWGVTPRLIECGDWTCLASLFCICVIAEFDADARGVGGRWRPQKLVFVLKFLLHYCLALCQVSLTLRRMKRSFCFTQVALHAGLEMSWCAYSWFVSIIEAVPRLSIFGFVADLFALVR